MAYANIQEYGMKDWTPFFIPSILNEWKQIQLYTPKVMIMIILSFWPYMRMMGSWSHQIWLLLPSCRLSSKRSSR